MRQKRQLFKGHSICTTIEQKKASIFNLQSATTTITTKDQKGIFSATTVTSSTSSSSETHDTIKSLQTAIQSIHRQLNQIKKTERIIYQQRIKRRRHNEGSYIRRHLSKITSHLNSFTRHLQQCIHLVTQNTVLPLNLQAEQSRRIQLQQEMQHLNSTNNVHNVTSQDLPEEFVTLLNKGTNFIPTADPCHVYTLKRPINEEDNSALCQSIKTTSSTTTLKTKSSKSNHRYRPYSKQSPTKLQLEQQSQQNFNFHLIDCVLNTIHYSKEYFQSVNLCSLLRTQHFITTP